ncbi:MAG: zinc ribbon domain-containing protein [Lachnospiraceae bacterium]|nr:zinc ribbon domain-containing protein [Lachnospiraceae bacterium]
MKCESCGAALSLEMVYCPYCGKENVAAKKHVSDMAFYKGEFEETKKQVYEKTNAYTHNAVKIAVVAFLAVLWIVLLILTANSYEFRDAIINVKNNMDHEEIEAQIWEFLEDEEYYALAVYCSEKDINAYDFQDEEYLPIIRQAEQYRWVYEYLVKFLTPNEYDLEYRDDDIKYLADYIEYFYDTYTRDWEGQNYYNTYDMSVVGPELDKMEKKLQVLLIAYLGLTEEEAAGIADLTTGQRITLLEEGLLNEEE